MIIATHGIVASQIVLVPVATAATSVTDTSFVANWNAYTGAVYYLLDVSTSSSFSSYVLQDLPVYTNSYSVTGLASNTTYYYRVRASTEYDTDAQAFFTRVTTAGGSLTTTEQQATNTLVLSLKGYSIWSKMKAIYPMVGASAAACAQNLKSSSFTGTFTATGWTYASTGVTGNGTSAYMNTNYTPSTQGLLNDAHFSVYLRSNISASTVDCGAYDGTNETAIYPRHANGSIYTAVNSTTFPPVTTNNNSRAFFICTRISSTIENTFINTTKYSRTITSIGRPIINIYIGANNNNGTASNYSNRENAFASIGDGLTDTEAGNFYTAVQAFQTTLARQV